MSLSMTMLKAPGPQDLDIEEHGYPCKFMCGALNAFFMDLVTSMVHLERKGWVFEP